ncbi:MAG TPA: pyridoxamine 5'-phosphate oxidase [Mycobacteriales bacterium]|nr:pyridoxamine 5'-phosphate oxidase [Mycobacteriales bacterium]
MRPDLAARRRDYSRAGLGEADLAPTWHEQFDRWLAQAQDLLEPNAVVLATATPDGVPSARTVLLKDVDERGFVVFTNLTSRKGRELTANPRVALVFPWLDLERQVTVTGTAAQVARDETEAYFRSRPRTSQVGAWVSHQSDVIAGRDVLERREAELTDRFAGGEVPVPEFWGGVRVAPDAVEFWQGRTSRLHDRLRYLRTADGWAVQRLAP